MRQQRFWYEVTADTGTCMAMLTNVGNPGFPFLDWRGIVTTIPTHSRGSWIPMIRPYFGPKPAGNCTVEPVELASFEVTPLASALRLDWTTATEINNHGFYVERRTKNTDSDWKDVAFAAGAGTSNTPKAYNHVDNDVVSNVTYQYRLRQEDRDGSVTYSAIREGRLMGASTGVIANKLEQNTPNPFSASTQIGFTVAQSGNVAIEIYDIYGTAVRTYNVDATSGVTSSVMWDGRDAKGVQVPNGVYVYKLVGNGFTVANKMTVAR
jgi:hypothetical protein